MEQLTNGNPDSVGEIESYTSTQFKKIIKTSTGRVERSG